MDGISNVAAIVGLVQAVTQATSALNRYVSRVKEAEPSRARLLQHIVLISAVAKVTESAVRSASPSFYTPELQTAIDLWFNDDGLPSKCKARLEELSAWLESQVENNGSSKYKKLLRKMRWPSEEDKIKETIKEFDSYMPHLKLILSSVNLRLGTVCNEVATVRDVEQTAIKSESLLSWFDGFDCTNKQEFTLRQRQEKTGDWLFKKELYIDWRTGSTSFIWLHGKPGAGKSVIASTVIDDLSNSLTDNETLAYFYCDFRNTRCTRAMEVLRSLTKQLLWNSKKDWPSLFSDLTTRKERGAGSPTDLLVLLDLLKRAAALHERPIMVVDALDECEDLSDLLDVLIKLVHAGYCLFVTSQTFPAIKGAFTDLSTILLDELVDEVQNDIHSHIENELASRSRLKRLGQDLKDEIQGVLVKKADGMFRWAQCQLDRLNDCCSPDDIRGVLGTLPETLHETYGQMLCIIDRKPPEARIARRALMWLVAALRPLKLPELAEALALSTDEPAWNSAHAPWDEQIILEILGSFVVVDRTDNMITLSHSSVKEYLTSDTLAHSAYYVTSQDASFELAKASIFALILRRGGDNSLSFYADDCGLRHLADCDATHDEILVKHLLTLQDHIFANHPGYKFIGESWHNAWMVRVQQVALYIILRYGNLSMLGYYLACHPIRATPEENPLVFAAWRSSVANVQLMLEKGLDANLEGPVYDGQGVYKITPLVAAARHRTRECQEPLIQFLLANGCIVPRDAIRAILSCGVYAPCNPTIVRVLLDCGADPKLLATGNNSSLHLLFGASGIYPEDQLEIAQMLVGAECDPMAPNDEGHLPFHHALPFPSFELVKGLTGFGWLVPSDAILHVGPFVRNIEGLYRFLVENGALPNAQDKNGNNALHLLCRWTRALGYERLENTLRLLIELGCNINCRNERGETPFCLAVPCSYSLRVVDLFISQGAEIPVDIINRVVGLCYPCRDERAVIAALTSLKESGASFLAQIRGGGSALHCLLVPSDRDSPECILAIASFLIENGCDIHATYHGVTPYELAIENGHFPVAETLLAYVASRRSRNEHAELFHDDIGGNSILHRLCHSMLSEGEKFIGKVKFLQEVGYDFSRDVNRRNNNGLTPLCVALEFNKEPKLGMVMVASLLDLGASFSHVDYVYLDNLQWAANLSWYHGATDAHRRYLSRSSIAHDDVILVQHLLRAALGCELSPVIISTILDTAEYWACMKVVKYNIRHGTTHCDKLITFPEIPGEVTSWIPRRVVFAYKASISGASVGNKGALVWLDLHVTRRDTKFRVPVFLFSLVDAEYDTGSPPKTVFSVWDEREVVPQGDGEQQLRVGELLPGDTLSLRIGGCENDYFTLEFFQMDVYYSMKPLTYECN